MTAAGKPLDLLLVGGGLANALLAYRLRQRRPDLTILVLEAGTTFGGNHTWSFHQTDLTADQQAWTAPFVEHRWPAYDVAFPDFRRTVGLAYCTATSDRLHAVTKAAGIPVRFGASVTYVSPTEVVLANGDTCTAKAVIDGRGAFETPHLRFGWQKFHGVEIETETPHGVVHPILMDATVAQHDGYRFIYVLPFGPNRLLVEDTYYSDRADIQAADLALNIDAYANARGWKPARVLRNETGVLPITLAGDARAFWNTKGGQPCTGLRAGLFHPTTGYSWPDAVRLADRLAQQRDLTAPVLFKAIRRFAEANWRRQRFFRALDRMLFLAGAPERRWQVMQRFYRFDEGAISRFYAGRLRLDDKIRLLVGRPPVPIVGAIAALLDTAVTQRRPVPVVSG